jgi:serine/threonine protein kinase/Tfp pilus assembly protein PilF
VQCFSPPCGALAFHSDIFYYVSRMKELLPANTVISHYRITSRLGAGGMGEVYLAEDTRLGRRVALKLLPAQFIKDEDRLRRFEQEARAASALNHPNIITIHEVGVENGTHFIATELIEGETLRQRLKRERMSLSEALDVAVQVASALAAAHQVGIIHRDTKPENIMLRPDGYVKVLDFGIAKLTEKFVEQQSTTSDSMDAVTVGVVNTEANIVMGSPSYMSPEQARGQSVDGRTDIFSLGVILYEMIAGQRPFDGPSVSDIIVAILERQPPPLSRYVTDISPRLENIVAKSLAKDRESRYQTITDMLADLKRQKRRVDFEAGLDESVSPDFHSEPTVPISPQQDSHATVKEFAASSSQMNTARSTSSAEYIVTEIKQHKIGFIAAFALLIIAVTAAAFFFMRGEGRQPINSIAVLPFANESSDPNTEYLSDGITESLINNLSQSRSLKVMSRNSVFRYKGQDVSAKTVADDLSVQGVLTGRIVQLGDNLTIKIELIDARDNTQVWGEQYSRKMSEIISMQEEIAKEISEKLQLRLTGEDEKRVSKRYTNNSEAYQLYLRGRFYWNKRTEESLKKGIEYFNQAIEKDPLYALPYVGVANCYAVLTELETSPPKELYPKVKAAAARALEIDDSLAEAHTALAAVNEYEWNWAEAENQYKRAIELNPSYETAHHWYAAYLISRSRSDEAIREMRQALELDPLSLIINTSMGRVLFGARQYDQAIEQLKKTLDLDPNFAEAHFQIGMVYEQKRMYDDAIREFQKSVELFDDQAMTAWVARAYAVSGRRAEAERLLAELMEMSKQKYVSPYPLATVYAALGDKDRAFEWLEKVYEEHSYYVIWLNIDPIFDQMRTDARFTGLLNRVGFTQ